jgi:hypothetical protein
MNREMWAHPATQRNVAQVARRRRRCWARRRRPGLRRDRRRPHAGADELRDELIAFFQPKLLAGAACWSRPGPPSRPSTRCAASPTIPAARWALPSRAPPPRPAPRHAGGRPGAPAHAAPRDAHRRAPARSRCTTRCCRWRRARRLRGHRGGGRLAARGRPASTRSRRTAAAGAGLRADREPRHPGHRGAPAAATSALVRGLCRREPRPGAPRAREAAAQGRAADRRQPRPGHLRPRRQRAGAGRRRTASANCRRPTSWWGAGARLVREIASATGPATP